MFIYLHVGVIFSCYQNNIPVIRICSDSGEPFGIYIYIPFPVGGELRRGLSSMSTVPATEEELQSAQAT